MGFDINCGIRLLRTNLTLEEIKPKIEDLLYAIHSNVPSGVGSEGKLRINEKVLDRLLVQGAGWAVEKGFGQSGDLVCSEESGCLKNANSEKVSEKAKKRGLPQLGLSGLATIL